MNAIKAFFRSAIFENGYMWVFDDLIQSICRIDIHDFKMEIVSSYRGKEKFIAQRIFLFQDKFYLVEGRTLKVLIYDRRKQETDSGFCIQDFTDSYFGIYITFFYEGYIYFLPRHIDNEVICFDTFTKRYLKKKTFKFSMHGTMKHGDLVRIYPYSCDGSVWFTLNNTAFYGKYDFSDERISLFQTKSENIVLKCCFDGKQIWLTDVDGGNLICEGKGSVEIQKGQSYTKIYSVEDKILMLSQNSDKLVCVDKETLKVSFILLPLSEREKKQGIGDFCDFENYIFLFFRSTGSLFVFDKETLNVNRVQLKCENYIQQCFVVEKVLLGEDESITLRDLLHFSGEKVDRTYDKREAADEAGHAIWRAVLK